jgi:hypothetical protein
LQLLCMDVRRSFSYDIVRSFAENSSALDISSFTQINYVPFSSSLEQLTMR